MPWGNKLGFTATNTVNAPSPNTPAFNWDNGYNGVVKTAALDPSAAYSIWGPVSWDPDGGRVGYTQQWNFNIQRELRQGHRCWISAISGPRALDCTATS